MEKKWYVGEQTHWTAVNVVMVRTSEDKSGIVGATSKKYAQLIATTPKLLEVCEQVHDIINSYSHIPAMFKACKKLQAVITEAKK